MNKTSSAATRFLVGSIVTQAVVIGVIAAYAVNGQPGAVKTSQLMISPSQLTMLAKDLPEQGAVNAI